MRYATDLVGAVVGSWVGVVVGPAHAHIIKRYSLRRGYQAIA